MKLVPVLAWTVALNLVPVTSTVFAQDSMAQAGFDCAKANAPIEKTICADKTLAMLDREMTRVLTLTREDASVSQPKKPARHSRGQEWRAFCRATRTEYAFSLTLAVDN